MLIFHFFSSFGSEVLNIAVIVMIIIIIVLVILESGIQLSIKISLFCSFWLNLMVKKNLT